MGVSSATVGRFARKLGYSDFRAMSWSLRVGVREDLSLSIEIQVSGFRCGHVPAQVIDQRVGRASVIQEAVNNKLSDFYRDAVAEADRVPMAQPEVEVTELPNVTGAQGGRLGFTAEVTVRPQLDLPDLGAIEGQPNAFAKSEYVYQLYLLQILSAKDCFQVLATIAAAAQ